MLALSRTFANASLVGLQFPFHRAERRRGSVYAGGTSDMVLQPFIQKGDPGVQRGENRASKKEVTHPFRIESILEKLADCIRIHVLVAAHAKKQTKDSQTARLVV